MSMEVFLRRSARLRTALVENINHVIVRLIELRLRKHGSRCSFPPWPLTIMIFLQPLRAISSMVSCNSSSCNSGCKQLSPADPGFENLSEIIFWKD